MLDEIFIDAIKQGHLAIFLSCIERGVHLDRGDRKGDRPLHLAVIHRRYSMIETLLCKGANIDARNALGNAALHEASLIGDVGAVNILIRHGADVEACNHRGHRPLHYAVSSGSYEVVKKLLRCGADANAPDDEGRTPMHWCLRSDPLLLFLLYRFGGDLGWKDRNGQSPLDMVLARLERPYWDGGAESLARDVLVSKKFMSIS